ncbi:LamG-like jellyroll fold domain-containing protein [Streptomyces sp. NPDC004435]|uniref:LamG-like jellyroll fold domain-containing protein n=1 Tax=Streptomyces sp. NPDC004435 TaxID=3364701 RepID=UPI0036AD12A0
MIPKVTVEVAFDGGPFSKSYTWTDISDYVRGFQVRRGRNYELDRIEAGTLSLALDNSDGRFTPGKQKSGANALADAPPTDRDLTGAAGGVLVEVLTVPQVEDDGRLRFVSRTVYTNGLPVACHFAVQWRDAQGWPLKFDQGTPFVADRDRAVYTHAETPPPGAASALVHIVADHYPEGNGGLVVMAERAEWVRAQPYYPNVVPRRRVRVRTSNLAPRDVSTGGDSNESPRSFDTFFSLFLTECSWEPWPKSGTGSIRVKCLGSHNATPFGHAVRCGRGRLPAQSGMTRVVPGRTYSASAAVQLGGSSPNVTLAGRFIWHAEDGSPLYPPGARGGMVTLSGPGMTWSQLPAVTSTAPTGAVWATFEIGTQTALPEGAEFYLDEVQIEEGSQLGPWSPGGSIFHGYIERWPMVAEGLTATVDVTAVDGMAVLASTDLRTPVQEQVMATDPLGYWPLGDAEGATRLENVVDDQRPARLAASKYGPGTARLGADPIVRTDPATSYSLANVAANQGTVVDVCENGARGYPLASALTVAFWCQPVLPSAGAFGTLFRSWAETGGDHLKLQVNSSGKLVTNVTFVDGSVSLTSSGSLSTSKPTFIVVSVRDGLVTVCLNGDLDSQIQAYAANDDLRNLQWSSLGGAQAGSYYQEYANGRYGHLAIWDRELRFSEISEIWAVGDFGGKDYPEDEASRITRLAGMARFAGELALDAGMSALQGPSWTSGAKALDVIQEAAEDASGYVFMDGDGRLTYHSRSRRQGAFPRFRLGDSLGLPYEPGLTFEMDESQIINEVTFKRPNGSEGVLKDRGSIAAFGRKSRGLELRLTTDAAVQNAAYSLLNLYSSPVVRCDSVSLNATATPALFQLALAVEIGDRIKLTDLPDQAPDSSLDFYVEAVSTDVAVNGSAIEWHTTLSLSPAGGTDVWILESSEWGRLDRSTVLAY